jgi:hypothetical protein
MSKCETEVSFLSYITRCNNNQKKALLGSITYSQKEAIKEIAVNIVQQRIPVSAKIVSSLYPHRHFLRKLSSSSLSYITKESLVRNYKVISNIIEVAFDHYDSDEQIEICKQTSVSSDRRMAGNKKQSRYQQYTSDSSETDSESKNDYSGETSDSDSITSSSSTETNSSTSSSRSSSSIPKSEDTEGSSIEEEEKEEEQQQQDDEEEQRQQQQQHGDKREQDEEEEQENSSVERY